MEKQTRVPLAIDFTPGRRMTYRDEVVAYVGRSSTGSFVFERTDRDKWVRAVEFKSYHRNRDDKIVSQSHHIKHDERYLNLWPCHVRVPGEELPRPEYVPTDYPKLTSDKYDYVMTSDKNGHNITLINSRTGMEKKFFIAGHSDPDAVWNHMNSLTDDLCDDWLDPEAKEAAKKAAKEAEKLKREAAKLQAEEERAAKQAKKEENRRKQLEALQRKQETQSD